MSGLFFRVFFVTSIAEEDWGADERIGFADFAFQKAFPRPVEQAEIMAVDDKPRRVGVGLDDVFWLWMGVF